MLMFVKGKLYIFEDISLIKTGLSVSLTVDFKQ